MKTISKTKIAAAILLSCSSWISAQAGITGTASVCVGATTALTNATADGVWTSSNTTVATVGSGCGLVLGIAQGTAIISYTTGDAAATMVVSVNPTPQAITGPSEVCTAATMTLNDIGSGKWTSDNVAIATVGATTGLVTGKVPGVVNITYTLAGGCQAYASVTVDAMPSAIAGAAGVCPGSAITLSDAPPGGAWYSDNSSVASVDTSTGVVTGIAAGTVTISYAFSTGCQVTKKITVYPLPLSITGQATICTGASTTMTDAGGGKWSSSNIAVAAIASTGLVTGKTAGTATITYTLSTGCITTSGLTVSQSPSAITGSSGVCQGMSITLSDAPPGGTWTNDNTAIATVGATGIVTGISPGSTTVTYAFESGCMATKKIAVNALPNPISGPSTVCVISSITLTDTLTGKWTANAATVSVGVSNGIVTGKAAGTAVITYTLSTGCITTTVVTVNPLPSPIAGSASICIGSTTNLSCQAGCGNWSCNNTGVAAVCSSGTVTGVSAGSATLTYTLNSGCGVSIKKITIYPLPSEISGTDNVCTGSLATLTDAGSGRWSSSNTNVATINPTKGKVTGISAGTTTITYVLSSGCSISKNITVSDCSPVTPLKSGIAGNDGDTTAADIDTTGSSNHGAGNTMPATSSSLRVYPNPNSGSFHLLLSSGKEEQGMIYITNVLGQKVMELQVSSNNPIPVVINNGQGIYIVTVIMATEKFEEKIIVH